MKKYLSFGLVGLILSLIIAFLVNFLGNKPNDIVMPFYQIIIFSLLIFFIPLLLIGLFLDLAKKNKIFKWIAIILLIVIVIVIIFLVILGFSFNLVS